MASGDLNFMSQINLLVAVGSVDGTLAATACLRVAQNPDIQLIFTQAFEVYKIEVDKWEPNRSVGLIDLGVNTEESSPNPQMTIEFISKIYRLGHKICFIADEHGKRAWEEVLKECGHSTSELTIKPEDRSEEFASSCAILMKALPPSADDYTKELLHAGNQADLMNFDTRLGTLFNKAIKSNMRDPERRPYLARWMAQHREADSRITYWVSEYDTHIQPKLKKILNTEKILDQGIHLYDGTMSSHDATAVFEAAYRRCTVAMISYRKHVVIATSNPNLNIQEVLQGAQIPVSGGMPAKASIHLAHLEKALRAISDFLRPAPAPMPYFLFYTPCIFVPSVQPH